jgi:hypothetical protein
MAKRYASYARLKKGGKVYERCRFLGVVLEHFLYRAFGKPRRGLYALMPGDVASVDLWDVTNADTLVTHRCATVDVSVEDAVLALSVAIWIVEGLENHGLRILEALPAGEPRVGDHDLVVERRGVRGKGSVEVKVMQVGEGLEAARTRERKAAEESACWVNARKSREGFAERFLAIWQADPPSTGGTLESRLEEGCLRVDVLRAQPEDLWEWTAFAGWPGYNLASAARSNNSSSDARSRSPLSRVASPKAAQSEGSSQSSAKGSTKGSSKGSSKGGPTTRCCSACLADCVARHTAGRTHR